MNHGARQGEAIAVADRIHHPEIHVADVAQITTASLTGEQVAGVGIRVEVAELEKLLKAADHPCPDQGGWIHAQIQQFPAVAHLGAIHPRRRQHTTGTEHPFNPRDIHSRVVGKHGSEALGIGGFLLVVNLFKEAAAEFIDDVAKAKTEVEGQQRRGDDTQQADQDEVAAEDELQSRPLNLHRHPGIALEPGFVHLTETGSRNRMIGKLLEQLIGRSTELLLDPLQGDGMGEGGKIVLQPGEFLQPVATHEIWAR